MFEKALILEAGLQLAESVHLRRPPQIMQISTNVPAQHSYSRLKGCMHQVPKKTTEHNQMPVWRCGGLGHFIKIARLPCLLSTVTKRINPFLTPVLWLAIWVTLTTTMPITNFTFKAILKESVSSAITNRKTVWPRPQNTTRGIGQPSTISAGQAATPAVIAMRGTSITPTKARSDSAVATNSSNYMPKCGTSRGPSRTIARQGHLKALKPELIGPPLASECTTLTHHRGDHREKCRRGRK